jgi:uncharacterized alpha-E superfamily protein
VLSRIAGNCFWLGRYLERAENTARVASVAHSSALIPVDRTDYQPWLEGLKIAGDVALYGTLHDRDRGDDVAEFLLIDRENPSSVVSCLRSAGSNAQSARNQLGDGYWEAVNATWIVADNISLLDLAKRGAEDIADWAINRCRLIRGCTDDLLRDELPNVISAGVCLERADYLLRLLAVSLPPARAEWPGIAGSLGYLRLENLLNMAAVRDAFRRLHGRDAGPAEAAAMLLSHPGSPRSVLYNIVRLEAALAGCTGGLCPSLATVVELRGLIRQAGAQAIGDDLWGVLAQAHLMLGAVASSVERDHFALPAPPVHAAETGA